MDNILTLTTSSASGAVARSWANVNDIVDLFAENQDCKATTRDLYGRILKSFFAWVNCTGRKVSALTLVDLIAYKDDLTRAGKSPLTIGGYINALKRFYAWVEANAGYPNIAAALHAPKRTQEFKKRPLSARKVGELLAYERTTTPRDYAIINLMARTGLRCIEVARANVGDITYMGEDNTRVLMVQGKGKDSKDNFVVLTDAAWRPIAAYLATRKGAQDGEPLFFNESNHASKQDKHQHDTDYNGRRLSTRTISGIAKRGLKEIGLDGKAFSAHSLRHSVGTAILRAGGTLEQAQMTLRHANPATTQIYTRMALTERRFTSGGERLVDQVFAF